MRFVENGPNIPNELLWAHDDRQVVFICGAGVSIPAGLPDFPGLADGVMSSLHARDTDAWKVSEAIKQLEKTSGVSGVTSADRVFSLLLRDFSKEKVVEAVCKELAPPKNVDLSFHQTILQLARGDDARLRLITTNFDRLFEACNRRLKPCTRTNLPNVDFDFGDWGVVHLHGIISADGTGSTEDCPCPLKLGHVLA